MAPSGTDRAAWARVLSDFARDGGVDYAALQARPPVDLLSERQLDPCPADPPAPSGPGIVGPVDGARHDGDSCPEKEPNGSLPKWLDRAVPGAFTLSVDADPLPSGKSSQSHTNHLRVYGVTPGWDGI